MNTKNLSIFIAGTNYLVLQFTAIDFISIFVALPEIWTIYNQNWRLNTVFCQLFLGSEALVNVIIVYFHILLNLHAISTWNLQNELTNNNKNPLTSRISDLVLTDESNECLIWLSSELNSAPTPSNRTLINIDYRHKQTSVSIIIPCILIWFCCLSISIPEYTLSTTIDYKKNISLCTIIDLQYTFLLRFLLIFFRDILPVPILIITFIISVYKLCYNGKSLFNLKKNTSAKKFADLRKLLILSIILSLIYFVGSFQRSVIQFLHIVLQKTNPHNNNLDTFKIPPLDNFLLSKNCNLFLAMFHYTAIVVRPIMFIIFLPSIVIKIRECFVRNK